jgi:hypothetical protein
MNYVYLILPILLIIVSAIYVSQLSNIKGIREHNDILANIDIVKQSVDKTLSTNFYTNELDIDVFLRIFNADIPQMKLNEPVLSQIDHYKGNIDLNTRYKIEYVLDRLTELLNNYTNNRYKLIDIEFVRERTDNEGRIALISDFLLHQINHYSTRKFTMEVVCFFDKKTKQHRYYINYIQPVGAKVAAIEPLNLVGVHGEDTDFIQKPINKEEITYGKLVNVNGDYQSNLPQMLLDTDKNKDLVVEKSWIRNKDIALFPNSDCYSGFYREPCRQEQFGWDTRGVQWTTPPNFKGGCSVINPSDHCWGPYPYQNPTVTTLPRNNDGPNELFDLSVGIPSFGR